MRKNTIVVDVSVVPVRPKAAHQHLKHSIVVNAASYKIPVYIEDGATNVRVHDVPPQMPNDELVRYLNRYGEVLTIANEVWRNFFMGLPNGVRVARMKIHTPIPSYIQVGNDTTLVTYKNQTSTCRHCGLRVHRDMKCLEAAAQQKQQQQQQQQHQQQPQEEQRQQLPITPQQQQQRKPVPKTNSKPTVSVDCTETEQKGTRNNKRISQNEILPANHRAVDSDMESISADDVHLLSTDDFIEWASGAKKFKKKKKLN